MDKMCWRSCENKRTPGAPFDPALCVLFDLFLEQSVAKGICPTVIFKSLSSARSFFFSTDNCASFPLYYLVTMLQTHIWKTYLGTNRKIALCCVCFGTVVIYFAFTTSFLLWPFFSASMCIPAPPRNQNRILAPVPFLTSLSIHSDVIPSTGCRSHSRLPSLIIPTSI